MDMPKGSGARFDRRKNLVSIDFWQVSQAFRRPSSCAGSVVQGEDSKVAGALHATGCILGQRRFPKFRVETLLDNYQDDIRHKKRNKVRRASMQKSNDTDIDFRFNPKVLLQQIS
jgi:hypothetical protein